MFHHFPGFSSHCCGFGPFKLQKILLGNLNRCEYKLHNELSRCERYHKQTLMMLRIVWVEWSNLLWSRLTQSEHSFALHYIFWFEPKVLLIKTESKYSIQSAVLACSHWFDELKVFAKNTLIDRVQVMNTIEKCHVFSSIEKSVSVYSIKSYSNGMSLDLSIAVN